MGALWERGTIFGGHLEIPLIVCAKDISSLPGDTSGFVQGVMPDKSPGRQFIYIYINSLGDPYESSLSTGILSGGSSQDVKCLK